MPVTYHCPGCTYTRDVPDNFAGQKVKCPQCGSSGTVPMPQAPTAAAQPTTMPMVPPDQAILALLEREFARWNRRWRIAKLIVIGLVMLWVLLSILAALAAVRPSY